MGARDAFEFINELNPPTVEALIQRLEFRGIDPTFVGFREAYLAQLALPPAAAILDLGCGTGIVARALAARGDAARRVVGLDQSPALIAAARRLAAAEGVGERIDFRVGDVHRLDVPDADFDAAIAHTLVSHVTDPLAVLREAARVVRPGGWVVIFDGDYASWTFSCGDEALGKAMEEALMAAVVSKPRVMRDLPRLLRQAGLRRVETLGFVYADVGRGGFFASSAEVFAPLVVSAGLLPAAEVDRWLAEQRRAMEDETFFAACNYYAYLATR
jgi:ubiquinone/menaquinone biosynthesis C-methylase UbiE